ncbi:MAG: hypothetical protein C4519_26835 [Desulfobacteraceae bacterium]|nr:MAG: hypothetical protein C4519_26835 [Desulfobacteraceae bacterium]
MEANKKGAWKGEIWRKILNSVAHKYDCGVRFSVQKDRLVYEGDGACALEIVKEALALVSSDGSSDSRNIRSLLELFGKDETLLDA